MKPWEETWEYDVDTGRVHSAPHSILEVICDDDDGHLAAAAPEMYRALEAARRFITKACDRADVVDAIDAALAKARGEK